MRMETMAGSLGCVAAAKRVIMEANSLAIEAVIAINGGNGDSSILMVSPSRPMMEEPMIPTLASLTIASLTPVAVVADDSRTTVAVVADDSRERLAGNGGDNSLPMVGNIFVWN